jgi:quercetin 2,3-dioxygenase
MGGEPGFAAATAGDAMIEIRPAQDRGHAEHGWLDSRHTFSFADYYDERHMGFGPLRVINEDRVQPGQGFGTHSHRDMEIISYVLEGALEHKDSLGNGSVLRPGQVQRMSAGTGVRHSEFNHSRQDVVHFLQIWIVPERAGIAPSYEEREFDDAAKRGRLKLVGSRDGRDGSVVVHQDVDLYAAVLAPGEEVEHEQRPGRRTWIQVVRGRVEVNGTALGAGDGAAATQEPKLAIRATAAAEILLFDLA